MPFPHEIEAQYKLERDAIKHGLTKLHKNTRQLEEKSYASATVYGATSIEAAMNEVSAFLRDRYTDIKERKNGQYFKDVLQYLLHIEPEALAAIALKRTFDTVFSTKQDRKKPNTVANVTVSIGAAVEAECQIRWYESQDPQLFKKITDRYWHKSAGTQQRLSVARLMMNRKDYVWDRWSTEVRARLGNWLLNAVMVSTGWFETKVTLEGKPKLTVVVPTDKYLAIQERLLHEAELFSPCLYPMLIPPNDWTNEKPGGYLLNEVMRGNDLVRRGNPTIIQGETPIAFLNQLQQTAYKLNDFVHTVAKELDKRGYVVGKFKPLSHAALWEMPTKPVDIETNADSRQKYKREKAEAMNAKMDYIRSMHVRTSITLNMASMFEGKNFWIPWSYDYRGRVYPIPPFLSPQDTDFGKAMLRFAEEAFVTPDSEEWLAFQVATTYGLDKETIQTRLDWVVHNHDLISRVATDPLKYLSDWENAEEPWQFLAACEEFHHVIITCDRNYTSLPIAVDATCSGLQILAGLCKCKKTAELVNVLPSNKPRDAYKTVADACIDEFPERLRKYCDRTVTKRCVMTIPYNAKPWSNRQYIKEAFKKKGITDLTTEEVNQCVKAVRNGVEKVAPSALAAMDWISKEIGNAIKRGNETIEWCTPSGFVVYQKRNKYTKQRLDLKLLGRCAFSILGAEKGPDISKHKASGSPNLIHSLDSSLLHIAGLRFDSPLSVIHDSVLCRATDMSTLSRLVRETYMHLFAEQDYLTSFAQQIGAETEPPIIGDLEPESVIESTYFFC